METNYILTFLFILAFALLVIVSGGVLYLTTIEWRDRRLVDKNKGKK